MAGFCFSEVGVGFSVVDISFPPGASFSCDSSSMFKSLNTGELLLIRRQKIRQGNSFEVHKIVVAGDQATDGSELAMQLV